MNFKFHRPDPVSTIIATMNSVKQRKWLIHFFLHRKSTRSAITILNQTKGHRLLRIRYLTVFRKPVQLNVYVHPRLQTKQNVQLCTKLSNQAILRCTYLRLKQHREDLKGTDLLCHPLEVNLLELEASAYKNQELCKVIFTTLLETRTTITLIPIHQYRTT